MCLILLSHPLVYSVLWNVWSLKTHLGEAQSEGWTLLACDVWGMTPPPFSQKQRWAVQCKTVSFLFFGEHKMLPSVDSDEYMLRPETYISWLRRNFNINISMIFTSHRSTREAWDCSDDSKYTLLWIKSYMSWLQTFPNLLSSSHCKDVMWSWIIWSGRTSTASTASARLCKESRSLYTSQQPNFQLLGCKAVLHTESYIGGDVGRIQKCRSLPDIPQTWRDVHVSM